MKSYYYDSQRFYDKLAKREAFAPVTKGPAVPAALPEIVSPLPPQRTEKRPLAA